MNIIRDQRGNIVGFRCLTCGEVFQSMWGNHCNSCRTVEKRYKELINTIKSSKK